MTNYAHRNVQNVHLHAPHTMFRVSQKDVHREEEITKACGRTDNKVLECVHLAAINKFRHVPQAYGIQEE
jgi:hypothetical protein